MAFETLKQRRARRNRYNLKQRSIGKLRLCVERTNKHIKVQLIDDQEGKTLFAASSLEKGLKLKNGGNQAAAAAVGKAIAERAKKGKVDVNNIVFDRGAFVYHGRVKALAESAREAGLKF